MSKKQSILALLVTAIEPKAITIDGVGEVYIKKLNVGEQSELSTLKEQEINAVELSLHLATYSLCDEKGNRLFDKNDIEQLKQMDSNTLAKLVEQINIINGFDKVIDDVKKN